MQGSVRLRTLDGLDSAAGMVGSAAEPDCVPLCATACRCVPMCASAQTAIAPGRHAHVEFTMRLRLTTLLLCLLTLPSAFAAEPPDSATQEALEVTRRSARSTAEWLARNVDSWFGDRPFEDGGKVSDGRLSVGIFYRRDAPVDVDLRFNARFRLPNVERRAYLFVGRDDPRDVVQDTPDALPRQQALRADRLGERSFLGGLGVKLLDVFDFRLGVSSRLKPYVQARYAKPWQLSDDQLLEFRQTLFWTSADRFGATTALSYGIALAPAWSLRWAGQATLTQQARNVVWSSTLGGYRSFGWERQLALEMVLNGSGTQGTGVGASDRGLLLKWEQPLHANWLFGELVGGHFWPRPDAQSERASIWAVGAGLKMRF